MTETNINDLPDEVLEFIFSHMPPYKDLQSCALVCKRWTNVVKSKCSFEVNQFHLFTMKLTDTIILLFPFCFAFAIDNRRGNIQMSDDTRY